MALVKETDADVYLHEYASIFAYHPPSRMLLWGCYNRREQHWELHKNGFTLDTGCAPHSSELAPLLTHFEIILWAHSVAKNPKNIEIDMENYIKGRISPDKSIIYIHDLMSRYHHPTIVRKWSIHIKSALHKVAMYMKEQTTEARTYDKKPLSAIC